MMTTMYDYSISSVSSASVEEYHSTSSATTSPDSSPNYHSTMSKSQLSPDLLQTDFYNSDTLRDHANNFRKSMIASESMESFKFHHVAEKSTGIAMTNSPSFSALASILEKKSTKYKPSPLQTDRNKSSDTIIPITEEDESQKTPELENFQAFSMAELDSPNLIQFDDVEEPTPQSQSKSQAPFYSKPQADDIFKTPEIKQDQFSPKPFKSMLGLLEEDMNGLVAEIVDTPRPNNLDNESYNEDAVKSPALRQITPKPSPKPLPGFKKTSTFSSPPNTKNNAQFSNNYSKRSTSLPVLVHEQPKKEKKKNFLSFFKSNKRSVSSNGAEQSKTQEQPSQTQQARPKLSQSKSFTMNSTSTPKVAQRSTSSTSLFSAFKRKSKVVLEEDYVSQDVEAPKKNRNYNVMDKVEDVHNNSDLEDDNDLHSFGSHESSDFQEDFNNLNVSNRPLSEISQHGEVLFPKSLSMQEVESIVSIERNRSVRSARRPTSITNTHGQHLQLPQPHLMSLTDSISQNARDEGMSIEFGRESSIPDPSKSPNASVLKKTSITSLKGYLSGENHGDDFDDEEELFNVEEFASQALEFDSIADNYEAGEDAEDISNLLEFADFIDFGGAVDLDFDIGSSKSRNTSPLSSPPLNQSSVISSSLNSPAISSVAYSPSLQNSPLSSPFLQQSAYIPGNMSRPISMSFRGLKAPAFEHSDFKSYSPSDTSSINSHQSSSLNSKRFQKKKVSFSSKITLYDVHHGDDYDRHPDIATCNQLTPALAQQIRNELNELKAEMPVHEDSRCYTHFF